MRSIQTLANFARNTRNTRNTRPSRPAARGCAMEDLERRQMLAASPLVIDGSSGSDTIRLWQDKTGVTVKIGNWSKTYRGLHKNITLHAGAGHDKVIIDKSVWANLTISAGSGNDLVYSGRGHDKIDGGTGNDSLYGNAGGDCLYGNWGHDDLYGGDGNDKLNGNAGDDTLIAVGGKYDKLIAGEGFDNIWSDPEGTDVLHDELSWEELYNFAWHQVDSFIPFVDAFGWETPISKELNGQDLPDPYLTDAAHGYVDFGGLPLFGKWGPDADDVVQGQLNTCYYLAALSAMAEINPDWLWQSIVSFGDGTYGVQFVVGNETYFARVDADLAVRQDGQGNIDLVYAGVGHDDSIWVAIAEKAFAYFRDPGMKPGGGVYATDYSNCDFTAFETLHEAFASLGGFEMALKTGNEFASGEELFGWIAEHLDDDKAILFGSVPTFGVPVITGGGHAYSVSDLFYDEQSGQWLLELRNPWGTDGNGVHGMDDGYIYLTADQAFRCMVSVASSYV